MANFSFPGDDQIRAVEEIINFRFTNPSMLREALQAAGFISSDGNKKLALIGDATLKLILVMEGRVRNETRGRINNIVSTRASNAYLAQQGFSRGLDHYICNNPSQGRFISDGLMATTMEAILGAVFLESGSNISIFQQVVVDLGLSWPE